MRANEVEYQLIQNLALILDFGMRLQGMRRIWLEVSIPFLLEISLCLTWYWCKRAVSAPAGTKTICQIDVQP